MEYIIIYNAETDFYKVYTEEQVKAEIVDLIEQGYALDEIELYEATQKEVSINIKETIISLTIS